MILNKNLKHSLCVAAFLSGAAILTPLKASAAGCLVVPIPGTTITSNFGLRFHPVYKTWRPHRGTDMRARMHTPILASNSGKIIFAGWAGGGGNVIKIQGDDGRQTDYLHLSKAGVRVGESVQAGQKIALSGNTGHASAAPHLHFQVRTEAGTKLVDPKPLLCNRLPEKPGAGPDKKSPDGYPAPGVNATGGSWTASGPSGGGAAIASNISPLASYEGLSEMDIIKTESERRFMNPDWHQRVSLCGADYLQQKIDGSPVNIQDCKTALYREAVSINLFSNWVKSLKMESRSRIESMLAIEAAKKSKEVSERNFSYLRTVMGR